MGGSSTRAGIAATWGKNGVVKILLFNTEGPEQFVILTGAVAAAGGAGDGSVVGTSADEGSEGADKHDGEKGEVHFLDICFQSKNAAPIRSSGSCSKVGAMTDGSETFDVTNVP